MAERAMTGNTVSIVVFEDASQPPTKSLPNIPWFPSMTILEAMVLGQAMYVGSLEFQVQYNSRYGAFVNQIDSTPDKGNFFWLVQQNHVLAKVGVSEAIIFEDHAGQNVEVEWIYTDISSQAPSAQLNRKLQARESRRV
jgi:hypothetical protein